MKKILTIISILAALLTGTAAFAQSNSTIPQLQQWKVLGGSIVMSSSTAGLRVPSLNCTSFSNSGALTADANGNITCSNDDGGAGGALTPWTSNIDGAGFSLTNGGTLTAAKIVATSTLSDSTFNRLTVVNGTTTNATSTNFSLSNLFTFNGVTGSTWASFCVAITGSAGLCDGNDASGSGGSGNVATSSAETAGQLPYWTSTAGTPATLGSVATGTLSGTAPISVTANRYVIGGSAAITCTNAAGGTTGCLTGTDWTTFNNKISSTSLSATAPLTYNSGTGVFTCNVASGAQPGCLALADWTLFNNKISSTSISGASVISYNSGTGVITTTGGTFGSGNYIFPGQLQINSSTTLQNFTGLNSTTTNATTTSLFASIGVFTNLSVTGSSTLANFTALNATTSQATTTAFAVRNLVSCDTIDTDVNGSFRCGTDSTGAGSVYPFYTLLTAQATNTLMAFTQGATGSFFTSTSTSATTTFANFNGEYTATNTATDIGKTAMQFYNTGWGDLVTINIPKGSWTQNAATFPMNFNTPNKKVLLKCAPGDGTVINVTGAGTSTRLNPGNNGTPGLLHTGWGVDGCTFKGDLTTNQVGIEIGGDQGAQGALIQNSNFFTFDTGIVVSSNTAGGFNMNTTNSQFNNKNFLTAMTADGGEGINISKVNFSDCQTGRMDRCVDFASTQGSSIHMSECEIDDAQLYVADGNLRLAVDKCHFENPNVQAVGKYTFVKTGAGGYGSLSITNSSFWNGATTTAKSPYTFIDAGDPIYLAGNSYASNGVQMGAVVSTYGDGRVVGQGDFYPAATIAANNIPKYSTSTTVDFAIDPVNHNIGIGTGTPLSTLKVDINGDLGLEGNHGLLLYNSNMAAHATYNYDDAGFVSGTWPLHLDSEFVSAAGTSSFANASTSQFVVSTLKSCDTIDTDANGYMKCGTDATGGGGSWPFTTTLTSFGVAAQSTTTPIAEFGSGFFSASGTSQFANLQMWGSTSLQNFTGLKSTTTEATTTKLAVSGIASAIMLTNGSGSVSGYAGTSCTNQFPRSLSALGAATCASVANTDLVSSAITINGTSVSLGGTITVASTTLLANNNTFSGGNVFTSSTTLSNYTALNATTSNATSTNFFSTNGTHTNLTVTNAPIFSALTGLLKGNGSSPLTVAVNGTDFSLNVANTCGAGQHFNQVTATGVFTCTADTGGSGVWPFTTGLTNYGTSTQATTTPEWFQMGVYASSTSHFTNFDFTLATGTSATTTNFFATNASSTNLSAQAAQVGNLTVTGTCTGCGGAGSSAVGGTGAVQYANGSSFAGNLKHFWDNVNEWLAVGTSTPWARFSIQGAYGSKTNLIDIATSTNASGSATSSLFKVTTSGQTVINHTDDGTGQTAFQVNSNTAGLVTLFENSAGDSQLNVRSDAGYGAAAVNLFSTAPEYGWIGGLVSDTFKWKIGRSGAADGIYFYVVDGATQILQLKDNLVAYFIGKIGVNNSTPQHTLDVKGRVGQQPGYDCQILFMSQSNVTADQLGSATVGSFACEGNMFVDVNTSNAGILAFTAANSEKGLASGTPPLQLLDASIATPAANNLVFLKAPIAGSATSSLGDGIAMEATIRTPKVSTATTSVAYMPLGFSDAALTSLTTTASYTGASNGCWLTASSTPNWKLVCNKAGVQTMADTGFATSTTAFKALLVIDKTGANVYFNQSTTAGATVASANLPVVWLRPTVGVGLSNGTAVAQGQMGIGNLKVWVADKY